MRHAARIAAFALAGSSLLALSACGSEEIGLAKNDPYIKGATIFSQRCAGCHTLDVAGTQGPAVSAKNKEITDGPNFNQRRETQANVLYALRNGGFSNKIMPQNLVTGAEAEQVAAFLAKYAGRDAANPAAPSRRTTDTDEENGAGDPEPGPREGGAQGDVTGETTPDRGTGTGAATDEGPSFSGETTPDGPVTIEPDGDEVVAPTSSR